MTHAYYNEIDIEKAAVIREAIACGLIAPGEVDTRSITEVQPEDVRGYTQCHWFAGAGVWSYALRLAGWPDSRPCWTGSCPCPSFSCAGKGEGFDDARHLWPAWHSLVRECRPGTVFGEQVAAAIGHGWLDLVCGDMEAEEYAIAAAVLGAHSAGAPHIRQRLYFCAHAQAAEVRSRHGEVRPRAGKEVANRFRDGGASGERADTDSERREQVSEPERRSGTTGMESQGRDGRPIHHGQCALSGHHTISARLEGHFGDVREWRGPGWLDPLTARSVAAAGATRGFWADCDWWYGRDGRYRPIEPGVFPLAHGAAARVLALRCWGDAICPEVAAAFIESANEAISNLGAL